MHAQASSGYVANSLATAHALIRSRGAMTADDLYRAFVAKGWKKLTQAELVEAMAARPAWFRAGPSGAWTGFDADYDAVMRLESLRTRAEGDARAVGGSVAYLSGAGSVWHAKLECTGLWDGKAKAAAEGLTLRPITVETRRSAERERPGCQVCSGGG